MGLSAQATEEKLLAPNWPARFSPTVGSSKTLSTPAPFNILYAKGIGQLMMNMKREGGKAYVEFPTPDNSNTFGLPMVPADTITSRVTEAL